MGKVLLCTIQNDPPSLKTYDDEKRNGEPFSQNFKQMTRMCLKKDPNLRPSCARLLNHAFFKKVHTPDRLVNELLQYMDDVKATDDHGSDIVNEMSAAVEYASGDTTTEEKVAPRT